MAYIGKTPSQAVRSRYFYTASGGETSLSGADDNGDTLIFADGNYVDVYLNGVLLVASSDYNVNTVNTIAGLTALTASDIVEIVVYDTFSVFGGVFQGDLSADTITTNSINLSSTTTVSSVLDEDTMTSDSATALATQQSIKAYVDTQVATVPVGDITEVTAGTGLTGGGTSGAVTLNIDSTVATLTGTQTLTNKTLGATSVTGNVTFGDSDKAIFGAGSDLQIYHDGLTSYISDQGTGNLKILAQNFVVSNPANNKTMMAADPNAAATISYDGAIKLATTATGVDVTGAISSNKGSAGTLATFTDGVNSNFVVETSSLLTTIGNGGGSAALALKANNTEAMRINSSGNVGIGTTNITSPFVVNTAFNSGYISQFVNTGTGSDPNGVLIQAGVVDSAYILRLTKQDATDVLAVRGSGRVGIGTVSPARSLEVTDGTSGKIRASGTDGGFIECWNGSNGVYFGTAPAVLGSGGGGDSVIFTDSGFNQLYYTSGIERFRINSSGHITQSSYTAYGTPAIGYVGDAANLFAGSASDFAIRGTANVTFGIGASEKMRIDSSGRLIINDTNPSGGDTLTVYNYTIGSAQYGIQVRGNANGYSQYGMRFYDTYNTSMVGSITYNTTTVSYNTSSDYRLKENVTATWDATTRLKQLNPVRFNFIADADTTVDGFLAHEVQSVVPEAISGTHNGMRDEEYEVSAATGDIYTPATDDADEVIHSTDVERPEELAEGQQWRETTAAVMGTRSVPDYQGIDQSKLVPLLVKTIQELEARITALETAE